MVHGSQRVNCISSVFVAGVRAQGRVDNTLLGRVEDALQPINEQPQDQPRIQNSSGCQPNIR